MTAPQKIGHEKIESIWPGAVITSPFGALVVVEVGERSHSMGYGKVEMTATHPHCTPGTMIQTPWGMAEVVLREPADVLPPPGRILENRQKAGAIIPADYSSLKGPPMFDPLDLDATFDLAPVSLWLEDYSRLRALFDQWRAAGVVDIKSHLDDPERVRECLNLLNVLRVNQATLELFKAKDQAELVAQLDKVFSGDMSGSVHKELVALWNGETSIENQTVNYALDGKRLDVMIRFRILPGHESSWDRVMVSLVDITDRVKAEQVKAEAERHTRNLFDLSPVSLWVEDFSAVKRLMDDVRGRGISNFATFLKVHPDFVDRCMQEIRVIDVNIETLSMFKARDKDALLQNIARIFRDEMRESFAEQLQDLWNGVTTQQREVVNYSLTGDAINIHMQFAVMPDSIDTWETVLVSLMDITARKKAEAYLEYLGKHDVLTQLHNRTFYTEELNRLQRKGPWPVSILAIDLNGLKRVNDEHGHAAGDALLRRAGEVLNNAGKGTAVPARIGGDEFTFLMSGADEFDAKSMRERLTKLIELNNQFYAGKTGHLLSFAIGSATCASGEQLETALLRADKEMYEDKARHYEEARQRAERKSEPITPELES